MSQGECMSVHGEKSERESEREREGGTDRQTDRQTDKLDMNEHIRS